MKNVIKKAILASIIAIPAFGVDVVGRVLNLDEVSVVGRKGEVLKRDHMFPSERILVGVPVRITLPDVCTDIVGQETINAGPRRPSTMDTFVITVKGSTDQMVDACIAVMPRPVDTNVTVDFVNFNEVIHSNEILTQKVVIGGMAYLVKLNPKTEKVTVRKEIIRSNQ